MPYPLGDFKTGSKGAIGATALQLAPLSGPRIFGVLVKAAKDNTGIVYVGRSNVTADSAVATDGMELEAGDAVLIEVDQIQKVYVIASAAGQKVFYVAV